MTFGKTYGRLMVLTLALTGCFGPIDGDDPNRGLIVASYPLALMAVPTQAQCYQPDGPANAMQHVVIDSDSARRAYFDYRRILAHHPDRNGSSCTSFTPEPVDFSRYTLLGHYVAGGCNLTFRRYVAREDGRRRYVYAITVRETGLCNRLVSSMNWVLVPKLPPGYAVTFVVRHT